MSEKIKSLYSFAFKRSKLIVIFIFIAILLVGIFSFRSYGLSTDELTENDILLSNVKEYVRAFSGEDAVKSLDISSDVPYITEFHERDHGEAMYYAMTPLYFMLKDKMNVYFALKHLYTFLIFFGALICLYLLIKNLTGRRLLAIVGMLLLFLSPRMFAESFYNVKDLVLMCLIIITAYFGYKFVEKRDLKYSAFFAIASAFSANLRVIGFFFQIFILILYFRMLKKSELSKNERRKPFWFGISSMVFFLIVFSIITPATWTSLIYYFLYTFIMSVNFFRWDGFVLYFNDVYNHNLHKLPWHYIPVLIAVTTPIITLLLMIFGAFDTSYKSIKSRIKAKKLSKFYEGNIKYYLLFLLFVLAPIMAAIILKSNIYNGWRHFYFVYGLLIVVAMGGLKTLIDYKKQALNIALTVAIGGQMVYSGIWIALNPGMQFAYFNPLAVNVTDNFEMDYWNVSAEKCLMQLLDSTKDEKIMISAIDEMGTDALNHAIVILPPEYAKRIQIIDCANRELFKVKYVIVNPSYHKQYELQYTKGYSKEPAFELTDNNSELITQVKVNSYPIMQIYEIKY